ncbi:hypothetical protein ACFE04_019777 [Oxalis oulophora]
MEKVATLQEQVEEMRRDYVMWKRIMAKGDMAVSQAPLCITVMPFPVASIASTLDSFSLNDGGEDFSIEISTFLDEGAGDVVGLEMFRTSTLKDRRAEPSLADLGMEELGTDLSFLLLLRRQTNVSFETQLFAREGPIQIHPVRTPAPFSFPVYPINALLHIFPIIALGMTSTDLHNGTLAEKALPTSKELKLSLTPQAFFAITR